MKNIEIRNLMFLLLIILTAFSCRAKEKKSDKTKILIYGVATHDSGVSPQTIAEHFKIIMSSHSLEKNIEVQWKMAQGSLLMESFHHPEYKDKTINDVAGEFDHVVLLDSSSFALKYPEFHFEGIHHISGAIKKVKSTPLLCMLWNKEASKTEAYAELAYRVGKGTQTSVIPSGYLLSEIVKEGVELSPEIVSYSAALSIYAQINEKEIKNVTTQMAGLERLANTIGKTALKISTEHKKITHYKNSCATTGLVRMKPFDMPKTESFQFIKTGTSTEKGWERHITKLLKTLKLSPKVTGLRNDDKARRFASSDLEKAQPFFEKSPNKYLILFARNFGISADEIRADNQRYLQCQIYDKAEPISKKLYTLKDVTAMVAHDRMVLSKYNLAIKYNLSMIPLHIAVARVYNQKPDMLFSKDRTHMMPPFLYMLAGMSYTSRTGEKCSTEGLDPDTVLAMNIGYETITQLANLSATGDYVPEHK